MNQNRERDKAGAVYGFPRARSVGGSRRMDSPPSPLAAALHAELKARGPQPFRWFMERALYDPEHGYYASGKAAIGRGGDFFTNVSVGPLFARLIAVQVREIWERLGAPGEFWLVEQGAADGQFAHDFLSAAEGDFAAALRYRIVEPFPIWQARQRAALADFPNVAWTSALEALPAFTGVHFSNELLDAFPVRRVVFREGEWRERCVAGGKHGFLWCDGPLAGSALPPPGEFPEGYETELSPALAPWLAALTARLERGAILAIDYGHPRDAYYAPERREGTLAAYAAHRRIDDPIANPGEIDLTAHVEFTSLLECARAAGLKVAGFTDQHHFMAALGLRHFREGDAAQTPAAQKERRAFATLMHPQLMGLSFHALCLAKNVPLESPLAGFALARPWPTADAH